MATINRTVSDLTFEVDENGDREISLTISFADGTGDDWVISVPTMILTELDLLLRELGYSLTPEIQEDDLVRNLIAEKDYTVVVQ